MIGPCRDMIGPSIWTLETGYAGVGPGLFGDFPMKQKLSLLPKPVQHFVYFADLGGVETLPTGETANNHTTTG